jgi:4-hydroxy-3-methylbut-2-en-1-yl diphosphate synthase IspG/GcpE
MKKKFANKLRCTEVAKYVCENLDEQLNSRKCQAIKKHLQTCPQCTKNLTDLKKVIALYRKESDPHLPQAIQKKLFATLKFEL